MRPLQLQHHLLRVAAQHVRAEFRRVPYPAPQDVSPAARLDRLHRGLADHAPVRHQAHRADAEAPLQALGHRQQRRHVGHVARPHLGAHRQAGLVQHQAHDHLPALRAGVLGEPAPAQALAPAAVEVVRGGVEEHQIQAAEQVPATAEQLLLQAVLDAARGVRALLLLGGGQWLAQPGHGAVQMLQLQVLPAAGHLVAGPAQGAAIRARGAEPMQDGEEHGALEIEAEAAPAQGGAQRGAAAGEVPEPLEDQAGAEVEADGIGVVGGAEHGRLLGELGAVGEQAFEGAGAGEAVVAAEVGDDALADLGAHAEGLDDLQIGMLAVGFEAEEHGPD